MFDIKLCTSCEAAFHNPPGRSQGEVREDPGKTTGERRQPGVNQPIHVFSLTVKLIYRVLNRKSSALVKVT